MQRVRLPRASSGAYRALRPAQEAAEAAAEQEQQQPVQEEAPQQQEQQQPAANSQLLAALNEIKAKDAGGLLEGGSGGSLRCACKLCCTLLDAPTSAQTICAPRMGLSRLTGDSQACNCT